jgi:serine protease Do
VKAVGNYIVHQLSENTDTAVRPFLEEKLDMNILTRVSMAARPLPDTGPGWWLALGIALAVVLAPSIGAARGAPESFADLAERLSPAVVNVSSSQIVTGDSDGEQNRGEQERGPGVPSFPPGSPFEEFFKEFFDRNRPQAPESRRATSLGSGFIIDPSGFVVTNNHVIADADEITVVLSDDTKLKAEIIGRDTKTDLALLKVESDTPLPFVKWGNSDTARVGDWIVAIGNPFGLGGSVTAGIVSARARDIRIGPYDDFIQTDASINRGNSGGPMFNLDGEVIGINTAIFSPTGGNVGIGFAIPSNLAKPLIDQLKQYGKPRRGWLGVRIQQVTPEIAESLGLKEPTGALVASVQEGGPAELSKIKSGDIILRFDGKTVEDMRRLVRVVADTNIDKAVPVVVWRDGKEVTLQVQVGEMAEEAAQVASAPAQPEMAQPEKSALDELGLTLAPLTDDVRKTYEVKPETKGVVVTDVLASGPAAEKGVQAGDVIVEVSQETVGSPAEVAARVAAAQKAGRKHVLVLLEGRSGLRWVPIRIDEPNKG